VFDALGRSRGDISWLDYKLDFTDAEAGVYLVKIIVNNRSVTTRIVKE
jgi:hypothetical protein